MYAHGGAIAYPCLQTTLSLGPLLLELYSYCIIKDGKSYLFQNDRKSHSLSESRLDYDDHLFSRNEDLIYPLKEHKEKFSRDHIKYLQLQKLAIALI